MKLKTLFALATAFFAFGAQADAPAKTEPTTLNVVTFAGGWNLPLWVAERQGFFEQQGLNVKLDYTPNSKHLIKGLLNNQYQIAIAGVDNVIAYNEGQGGFPVENPDLFAFLGVDNGLLSLVSQPNLKTAQDLKSKHLAVDSPKTGYAFVLYGYLTDHQIGLEQVEIGSVGSTDKRFDALLANQIDATLVRTPMNVIAQNRGLNILATGTELGDFQGTTGVATRRWAEQHSDSLVKFIRAYKAGLDWIYEPQNRPVAVAMLVANDKNMSPELANQALDSLLNNGLQRTAMINEKGLQNVMKLRATYAEPKKALGDPKKYYDLRYYQQAVK